MGITNKTLEEENLLAMETVNQQLMSCQESLEEKQSNEKHLSENLSKSNAKVEELVARLHLLEAETAAKDKEAANLLDDTMTALQMSEASEKNISKKLSQSQSENEELAAKLQLLKAEMSVNLSQSQSENEEIVAKLQLLEAEMAVKDREASKLLADMEASLSSTLKKNEAIEKELSEKLGKSQSDNEQLLARLGVLEDKSTADAKTDPDIVVDVIASTAVSTNATAQIDTPETDAVTESNDVVDAINTAEPAVNEEEKDFEIAAGWSMFRLEEEARLQKEAAETKKCATQLQDSLAKEIVKNRELEEKGPILEAENQQLTSSLDDMETMEASVKRFSEELNDSREKIAAMDEASSKLARSLEDSECTEIAAIAQTKIVEERLVSRADRKSVV